ncbi:MAG: DUF1566 domain-containing protein [Sulfurimonas sp.]|nr:DUF1566 domain-containing protein [Sulfurimonas sp.]
MKKLIIYLLLTYTLFAEPVLEWQDNKYKDSLSFDDALNYCQDLTHNGKDDWRLPDLLELTKYSKTIPYKNSKEQMFFWSSTVNKTLKITAWFVSLSNDYQHFSLKNKKLNVKCVRGMKSKMHYPACNNTKVKKSNTQKS